MIDRKTALASAALIALMLVAAVWRIVMLDDWTALAVQNETPLPSLLLFLFPACSALLVGGLHFDGRGARADDIKVQAWCKWAGSLSINYCGGMLLLQAVLIVRSLGLDMPFDLSPIGRAGGILLAIMSLLAINQMPKLPWFESRFAPGGDLGPIYGPRYMRTVSKTLVAFVIAVISLSLTTPLRSPPYVLLAAAILVVWSIAWHFHLGRKSKAERLGRRSTTS